MQYTGKCPKCGAEESHEYKNTPVWIKTENGVATNFCLECKIIFDVRFNFTVFDENTSNKMLIELEKGIIVHQYRPSFFSGYTNSREYVRNFSELIAIPWIYIFTQTEDMSFLHFAIGANDDYRKPYSILNPRCATLVAQYKKNHYVAALIVGDFSCLCLPMWESKEGDKADI